MHADLHGHKTSVTSEYTLPTTLTTILVVTCICHTHVVESHLSSARLGEEAHSIDVRTLPEQSEVFTHSNRTFSSPGRRYKCVPPHGAHVFGSVLYLA